MSSLSQLRTAVVLGTIALLSFVGCSSSRPAKTNREPFAGIAIVLQDLGWDGATITENFPPTKHSEKGNDLTNAVGAFLNGPKDRVIAKNIAHCSLMIAGPDGRFYLRCGDPPWDLRVAVNRPGNYAISLYDQGSAVPLTEIDINTSGFYLVTIKLAAGKLIRQSCDITLY